MRRSRWVIAAVAAVGLVGAGAGIGLAAPSSASPPVPSPQAVVVQNPTTSPVPVSGTVGIDPAHNQVTTSFTTVRMDSGTIAIGAGQTISISPIDVSAYKAATIELIAGPVGGTTNLSVTVADSPQAYWTLAYAQSVGPTGGAALFQANPLPTELFITATNNGGAGTFEYVLYLRGN
jgi:hypothetical protein